jgi:hypothetical protein
MNPRICVCCGQPMARKSQSRNPNLCASCSNIIGAFRDEEQEEIEEPSEEPYFFTPRLELPMFRFSSSQRLRINH